MFKQIDSTQLALVSGGKAACPQYASNDDVAAARSHMTKSQRAAEDRKWKQTVSHLSSDRLDAVRKQASQNAAKLGCAAPEKLMNLQLDDMKW